MLSGKVCLPEVTFDSSPEGGEEQIKKICGRGFKAEETEVSKTQGEISPFYSRNREKVLEAGAVWQSNRRWAQRSKGQ